MEAPFQIVGCVLSATPAAELIDAVVADVRRERAAIMSKSAQGATFVRFNAPDARLVTLACLAVRGQARAQLRFGFTAGSKDPGQASSVGLNIGTRSILQANDLAAGAGDGEVLVSPELAVLLIESGFALRSRQIELPGRGTIAAFVLDAHAVAAQETKQGLPPRAMHAQKPARPGGDGSQRSPVGAADAPEATDERWLLLQTRPAAMSQQADAQATTLRQADALGSVFGALKVQAEEIARKQSEFEARQSALLARMTLVDEGSRPTRHLGELDAELDAQMARVLSRLDFIEKLELRITHLQTVTADLERKLQDQLARRAEVENLKHQCDMLGVQMTEADHKLQGVSALQERLLPMKGQIGELAQALGSSQATFVGFEGRLAELDRGAASLDQKLQSLSEREAMVTAVKAQMQQIEEISHRIASDMKFAAERRDEVLDTRATVEDLLGRVEDTDDKIAIIESHRLLVDEIQSQASAFTHMLADIQVNLEMLGEQRAVVEHVGEKLARLDFTVQEAQNTLRALQREREVAERVEQSIKALRERSASSKSN